MLHESLQVEVSRAGYFKNRSLRVRQDDAHINGPNILADLDLLFVNVLIYIVTILPPPNFEESFAVCFSFCSLIKVSHGAARST